MPRTPHCPQGFEVEYGRQLLGGQVSGGVNGGLNLYL
jgi:hypothetical protein